MNPAKPSVMADVPAGENLLADIPVLKSKEEEEKKRCGVPWLYGLGRGGGGALGGSLDGAASSLSLSRAAIAVRAVPGSGLLGSGHMAQALASLFGRSTWLGGLFASAYGPPLILAGLAAWAGLVGAAGWRLASGSGTEADSEASSPLGPGNSLRSRLALDKPKDLSLDFLARANSGMLGSGSQDGSAKQTAGAQSPSKGGAAKKEGEAGPDAVEQSGESGKKGRAGSNDGRGGKLGQLKSGGEGTGLGGLARAFGGPPAGGGASAGGGLQDALASARLGGTPGFALKDMGFKPSSRLVSLPDKRNMTAARTLSRGTGTGTGVGSARNPILGAGGSRGVSGFTQGPGIYSSASGTPDLAQSARAMGQLKFADTMSGQAAASPQAGVARQAGSDAFEQVRTPPGGLSSGGGGGGVVPINPPPEDLPGGEVDFNPPIVAPIGAGAVDPAVSGMGPGMNLTPYQGSLNAAKKLGDTAGRFKKLGLLMAVLGATLIAVAAYIATIPMMMTVAVMIGAVGAAVIAMGLMFMNMAGQMAAQAKSVGNTISNAFQQRDQGEIVNECVDQALGSGAPMDSCTPATTTGRPSTTVREDVAAERNAGYSLTQTPPNP